MASFLLSPGVKVIEIDRTGTIPSVAINPGVYAGNFQWGPLNEPKLVGSESDIVKFFGKPTDNTYTSFYSVNNFLAYSGSAFVVRVADADTALNATSDDVAGVLIDNEEDFENTVGLDASVYARCPGAAGNSLKVYIVNATTWDDLTTNEQAILGNVAPENNELHIAIVDVNGVFTQPNAVLERFLFVSTQATAKKADGSSNFYKTVVNNNSRYVFLSGDYTVDYDDGMAGYYTSVTLTNGADGDPVADNDIMTGYDLFQDVDRYDISVFIQGAHSSTVGLHFIQNICDVRKDCMGFISPPKEAVVNNVGSELSAVTTFADTLPSTSYGVVDSGWKRQYDKYNDVFRWMPLNPDTAGLIVQAGIISEPWNPGAGLNRGQVKNVVKLAWSPNQAERDVLYPARVNPIVTFLGQGTVLWGQKTLLSRPSAFDRINVRRLFIIIEKAIAKFAKYQLFELNDEFSRAQFRNLVNPYLRDVQGRRGIYDFLVICDESNNTPEVIDANEFRADILVKPARSAEFAKLTFTAVNTGVMFEEVVSLGQDSTTS